MEIVRHLTSFDCATAVTVGSFDGVHHGHRVMIERLVAVARQRGLKSVVVTFEPHPRIALGRGEGLMLLTSPEEKARLIEQLGVDYLVVLDFTPSLAALSAEEFSQEVLVGMLNAKLLVAGYNHRFGHDRRSATEITEAGLDIEIVGQQTIANRKVSSSEIRSLIERGDYDEATHLLGHPIDLILEKEKQL